MNLDLVEKIADAVLYEGYMLYPYRASSVKNRERFNWGALVPKSFSEAQNGTEAWVMRTECLARGDGPSSLTVSVRFLHLTDRQITDVNDAPVYSLDVDGQLFQTWQEAVERKVTSLPVRLIDGEVLEHMFSFPSIRETEQIRAKDGTLAGRIVRTQAEIKGSVSIDVENLGDVFKVRICVKNVTPFTAGPETIRSNALLHSTISTHTIVSIENGDFVSLIDPPEELKEIAAACENVGAFPVLAGAAGESDCILASPIILYDYPEIAPESAGELFDGTEIDEILTLRIMTMTDEEKREMRSVDDRARAILERTEMIPEEHLLKMHGAVRGLSARKATNG